MRLSWKSVLDIFFASLFYTSLSNVPLGSLSHISPLHIILLHVWLLHVSPVCVCCMSLVCVSPICLSETSLTYLSWMFLSECLSSMSFLAVPLTCAFHARAFAFGSRVSFCIWVLLAAKSSPWLLLRSVFSPLGVWRQRKTSRNIMFVIHADRTSPACPRISKRGVAQVKKLRNVNKRTTFFEWPPPRHVQNGIYSWRSGSSELCFNHHLGISQVNMSQYLAGQRPDHIFVLFPVQLLLVKPVQARLKSKILTCGWRLRA